MSCRILKCGDDEAKVAALFYQLSEEFRRNNPDLVLEQPDLAHARHLARIYLAQARDSGWF